MDDTILMNKLTGRLERVKREVASLSVLKESAILALVAGEDEGECDTCCLAMNRAATLMLVADELRAQIKAERVRQLGDIIIIGENLLKEKVVDANQARRTLAFAVDEWGSWLRSKPTEKSGTPEALEERIKIGQIKDRLLVASQEAAKATVHVQASLNDAREELQELTGQILPKGSLRI